MTAIPSTPSSNPGTGILSSAGIGSGLNVDSIVTALVNAQKAGPQAQITNKATQANAKLTGLTTLGSGLAAMQAALAKLTSGSTFSSYNAVLGNATVGSTSTMANAKPGSYQLEVTQLATAQKRSSNAYVKTDAVGQGVLNIGVGSKSLALNVAGTDTLSDVADNINQSPDNPGVTATVVYGTGGAHLLLSSSQTGQANGFSISAGASSSSGLLALANQLDTPGTSEAKDAQLTLDGIAVTSASNSVSGAIDGVTINLTEAGSSSITVSQNTSVATDAVQAFVDAYNGYAGTVATLSSYDSQTKVAGVLLGDATLNSVQRSVSSLLSARVPGNAIGSLASLGITRAADGTLSVDSSKLNGALTNNPAAVQNLFAGADGYATTLSKALGGFTDPGGLIATREQSLTSSLTNLDTQQSALDARSAVYEKQLRQQYTALDTLTAKLNNTSSYLTSALKQLESTFTKSS